MHAALPVEACVVVLVTLLAVWLLPAPVASPDLEVVEAPPQAARSETTDAVSNDAARRSLMFVGDYPFGSVEERASLSRTPSACCR